MEPEILGKDVDDLYYHVTVTEYFMEGDKPAKEETSPYNSIIEETMDLKTPIKNCVGALLKYAIDYCKHHHMKSDNKFVVRLYYPVGKKQVKKKEFTIKGELSKHKYEAIIHEDFLASNGQIENELDKPIFIIVKDNKEKDKKNDRKRKTNK